VLRVVVAVLVVAAALVAEIRPAQACSCSVPDQRRTLAAADGAFIGTFLDKDQPQPNGAGVVRSDDSVQYRYRLDAAVKGEFPSVVTVMSAASGASCGLETPVGEQQGIFVYRDDRGRWASSLCSTTTAETMREVARALPRPDGRDPPAVMVGGSLGEHRLAAFDARGRPTGYGPGRDREVAAMAVCPGATRLVEVATSFEGPSVMIVRKLPELTQVAEHRVALESPVAVACAAEDGSDLSVWTIEYSQPDVARLRRVRSGQVSEVWVGSGGVGTFSPDARKAFVVARGGAGPTATAIDLPSGAAQPVGAVPERTGFLVSDASGTHLAAASEADGSGGPGRVTRIDLTTRPASVRTIDLGPFSSGSVTWAGDQLVYLGVDPSDPVRVYDASMRQRATWSGWVGSPAYMRVPRVAVVGTTVFGLAPDPVGLQLWSAPVLTGPAKQVRSMRGVVANTLVALPAPPPAPVETTAAPAPTTAVEEPATSASPSTTPPAEVLAIRDTRPSPPSGTPWGLTALAVGLLAAATTASVLVRRRRVS
jgi:hypothetical protein